MYGMNNNIKLIGKGWGERSHAEKEKMCMPSWLVFCVGRINQPRGGRLSGGGGKNLKSENPESNGF